MNINDCLLEGLLKKDKPSLDKARSSLDMAKHKLEIAEKEHDNEIYEGSIISVYSSMFHSCRALLFKDGFKERSHYVVYVYVKEKYFDKFEKGYLNELNSMRLERHELMYGLIKSKEGYEVESESAISVAKYFLEKVKSII